MKCQICKEPAQGVVVFRKESEAKTGYIVLDNSVSFDTDTIAKFLYYCQSKGLLLKNRGVVDLCHECLRGARILQN
jgi:hypothetical protein